MKIKTLELKNFRAIPELELNFDGKDATVYGANGTGKTTIANAVSWLLTDQPATGEKDFTPKTAGAHDLQHSARMTVKLNGTREKTFEKVFHEVWKKKRGSSAKEFSGHVTDYYINDVPVKKKDYELEVTEACGGDAEKIRMTTLLGYFAETMKPDDRRRILFEICGDVTDDEVIEQNGLEALRDFMGGMTLDECVTAAKAKRRKLNKELEYIPERIDELESTVTESDIDLESLKARLKEATNERAAATASAGDAEIEKGRARYLKEVNAKTADSRRILGELQKQRMDTEMTLTKLNASLVESREKIISLTEKRDSLINEYKKVQALKWEESTTCPVCGQPLPPDQVEASRAEFERRKAAKKKTINEEGQTCSKEVIAKVESEIKETTTEIERQKKVRKTICDSIAQLEAELQKIEPYEATPEYKKLLEAKKNMEPSAEKIAALDAEIQGIHEKLAMEKAVQGARARIAELKKEQTEAARALEHEDEGLHLCDEFIRAKVRMVTEKINSKFKTVSWLLFKEQINGGLKECCEPLIPNANGELVEYKSANTAAQVNAGLEIIETLDKHYGMNLPVIVDRAESVTKLIDVEPQVIRLAVSAEHKELTVEK